MRGKIFRYDKYKVSSDNASRVSFFFELETDEKTYIFEETLQFPQTLVKSPALERALESLHIALGISYYKTCLPPQIELPYLLTKQQAAFWNTVFSQGLGEFLLKNSRSVADIATFQATNHEPSSPTQDTQDYEQRALLGIGGGKDSIVAGELLKQIGIPLQGFVLATGQNMGQSQAVAKVMGVELLAVQRTIDPQLIEINEQPGVLNGHIPISTIFALTGVIVGLINKSRYVVVANEASASIPQATHEARAINHQWSKSLEFERLFQEYVATNITPRLTYFSAVRQLSSVAVAKLFAQFPAYFEVFTSDNSVFKMGQSEGHARWSTTSPKSLSSYILLAPWLSDNDLLRIFERDFLNESTLEPLFWNLLGKGDTQVLDCVGTPDELLFSLSLLMQQNRFFESTLMRAFTARNMSTDTTREQTMILSEEHAIPNELQQQITQTIEELLA